MSTPRRCSTPLDCYRTIITIEHFILTLLIVLTPETWTKLSRDPKITEFFAASSGPFGEHQRRLGLLPEWAFALVRVAGERLRDKLLHECALHAGHRVGIFVFATWEVPVLFGLPFGETFGIVAG